MSPSPTEIEIREQLAGNVCRCTGYGRIIDAVQQVAVRRAGSSIVSTTEIDITVPIGTGTRHGTLGTSPTRPDGIAKAQGAYAFSSDLSADGCLWGSTLRSPHPYARIVSIDLSAAWKISGVEAIITADDVPGSMFYGLISQDQPVFASDVVRYVGEPIAAVAADHPETCRRALEAIVVEYEILEPLLDPEAAIDGSHPPIHPDGNLIRHQRIVCGDTTVVGDVVVEGTYDIGMQDQAFLGPRSRPGGARPRRRRVSSCTSRPSGCTRTATRSRPASACPTTPCG